MELYILYVIIGLIGLFFGGNWLVQGTSRLAASLGIPALVIGLTVVAFGTSTPELLVSLDAARKGVPEIAIGNVVGSNIANIGLILGLAGLVAALPIQISLIRREIPISIVASVAVLLIALDGSISQVEGALLLGGLIVFLVVVVRAALRERVSAPDEAELEVVEGITGAIRRPLEIGRILVGLVVLLVGANLLVDGAVNIARALSVPEVVIGLTLVAIGTSLPELVTSIIAALNKERDILFGNVIGSNIFNLLAILAITAIVQPVPVPPGVIAVELPIMLIFALLLLPFAINQKTLFRWEAAVFLIGYIAFVVYTVTVNGVNTG
jgi:cation:H+ antiporter